MSASSRSSEPDFDPAMVLAFMAGCAVLLVLCLVAVEWPVLVWSLVHGRPMLLNPTHAIGGGLDYLFSGEHMDYPKALWGVAEQLPPPGAWVVLNVTGMLMALVLAVAAWLRIDLWSGRSTMGLASWDRRRRVKPRAWAKPRDWLHLQPRRGSRSGAIRRGSNAVVRVLVGERRAPEPVGGDSWNLGRLRGAEVRSAGELHELVVAPTRSGKTRRVVATEAIEHDGPAVILSNKVDLLQITREARHRRGPVWVYAPLTPYCNRSDTWTPLRGCERREHALLMAQWIFDADPTASAASDSSGGARFYNREAVELLMPSVLQAAALGGHNMADVLGWLRGGVDALDRPREILASNDDPASLSWASADALAGVQALDERPRSLLLMSAAQLISAYRLPAVQVADQAGFDPDVLLRERGTLYLIAPEGQTDALAPIFGGILGEILRACELRAQGVRDPRRLPLLKLLCDEAAHLAPLAKLPTLLSVSASWGVRFCVVYQSLAQIRHRYGVQADAVLANTLCKLFLGPIHDRATRDEIVALLGHELVEQTSHTTDPYGGARSKTRHEQHRPAISAEQLARIGEGEAIAIHGRELPAVVRLPFYDEWHPEVARR
jgi:type IV secretion system protein VirD4